MIGAELADLAVDAQFACAGLDEEQYVGLVVDVASDACTGVEPDEVRVEVASMRQAPDRPTRTQPSSTEIDDRRRTVLCRDRVAAEFRDTH